jgi:hypothetical protein
MSVEAVLLERLREQRRAVEDQLRALPSGGVQARAVVLDALAAGDQVFDVVSGQTGRVVSGTRVTVTLPAPRHAND